MEAALKYIMKAWEEKGDAGERWGGGCCVGDGKYALCVPFTRMDELDELDVQMEISFFQRERVRADG